MSKKRVVRLATVFGTATILVFVAWYGVFLASFFYASSKMQLIISEKWDLETVEARKGLLSSRNEDIGFLADYLVMLPQLDSYSEKEVRVYSLFGAYFTVVYSDSGQILAIVDNGLDG